MEHETIEEMKEEIEELKDMVEEYKELLTRAEEERDEYKNALVDIVDIGRKLV